MWFNWSPDFIRVRGHNFKPYNLFVRQGLCWGFGIIQIGQRHLFSVVRNSDQPNLKIYIFFRKIR